MKEQNSDKPHFVLHIHDYDEPEDNLNSSSDKPEELHPPALESLEKEKSITEELALIEATLDRPQEPTFIIPESLNTTTESQPSTTANPPPIPQPVEKKKPNRARSVIADTIRQFIASAIFLAIGFFLLNSGAYIELAKYQWEKFTGKIENSPLSQLTSPPTNDINHQEVTTLIAATTPETIINRLPPIRMEVAPTDNRIIIPRINKNIPIIRTSSQALINRDWTTLEREIQDALQGGVVHYPGTSIPGQNGNIVITGHSSYFPWDPGRFKDVFALLHEVVEGDEIIIYWEQQKYVYQVTGRTVVLPSEIEVLYPTPSEQLTLITCTPIGTNAKRLIIAAVPKNIQETELVPR